MLVGLQQFLPGHFPASLGGHATQHADQRGFHSCRRLIMKVAGRNAVDKALVFFTVGILIHKSCGDWSLIQPATIAKSRIPAMVSIHQKTTDLGAIWQFAMDRFLTRPALSVAALSRRVTNRRHHRVGCVFVGDQPDAVHLRPKYDLVIQREARLTLRPEASLQLA